MTTYDLDTRSILEMGETVNDATRSELSPVLLIGYNNYYMELCRNHIKPAQWDSVVLDQHRQFPASSLSNTLGRIKRIQRERGGGVWLDWNMQDGNTVEVDGGAGETVWVLYEYLPPELVHPNPLNSTGASEITLIPEQHLKALIYGGCEEVVGAGLVHNPYGAGYYNQKANAALSLVPSVSQKTVRNVYGY